MRNVLIKLLRGILTESPTDLNYGEPYYADDIGKVVIGNGQTGGEFDTLERVPYISTSNPTLNDDGNQTGGAQYKFQIGDKWINTNTDKIFVCFDNTTSNAIWSEIVKTSDNTLQSTYNNSTSPEIVLNNTNGAITIKDNATPVSSNLIEVLNNANGELFSVDTSSIVINEVRQDIDFTVNKLQKSGSITAFANAGGGLVTVTSNAHGLTSSDSVVITGTTSYNGTFTIINVTTNTFDITDTWVANDATGSWTRNDVGLQYDSGAEKLRLNSRLVFGNGWDIRWEESDGSEIVFMNLSSGDNLNFGAFTSTNFDTMNFRLGASTTEVQFDQVESTFNIGFLDRDFAIRKITSGEAYKYNAGLDDHIWTGATDANLLLLDGSADRVGIGTSAPSQKLEVVGNALVRGSLFVRPTTSGTTALTLKTQDNLRDLLIGVPVDGDTSAPFRFDTGNSYLFRTAFTDRFRIDTNGVVSTYGRTILNTNGGDFDTQIKGLLDDNLIYVDASADRVGVGTDTPAEKLDVVGNFKVSGNVIVSNQTADRLLSLNASKIITTLDTATYPSLTEISYIKGATSSIQTQLNNRELLANKAVDFSVVNDTKYPTVKAVNDKFNSTTLQSVYDVSAAAYKILTDVVRGALQLRRGSASDSDTVLEIQNGAGLATISVTGEGTINNLYPTLNITQNSHGFVVKDILYNNAGTWAKAQANSANTLGVGIVISQTVNTFVLVTAGNINLPSHGLTIGEYYYLSPTTAGLLTTTVPTALGEFSNPLLLVISSSVLFFLPWRPTVANGRYMSSILDTAITSATYTVDEYDEALPFDATSNNQTVSLLAPLAKYKGMILRIKKIDSSANTVTIDVVGGGSLIDGLATKVLRDQNQAVTLICDGTRYRIW